MEKQQTKSRNHGLQLPFHPQQVIAWVIFALEVLLSYIVFVPLLESQNKLAFTIIFIILQLNVIFFAFKATTVNPTDQAVYLQRATNQIDETLKHQCTLCGTRVGARSKHCGQCNRCVELFDHHCFWLNNCIGKANYKHFIGSVLGLFLESTLKIGLGISINVSYFKGTLMRNDMSITMIRVSVLFVAISVLLNILIFGFFLELLILHAWLKKHKMTTYELIVKKREQKMQKEISISAQESTDNQGDRSLEHSAPKQQKYQSKIITKVDQSSSTNNSFFPLTHSISHSGLKNSSSTDLRLKPTLEDRSPSEIPVHQATQSSGKKEDAPQNKLGLGENSFEISEISDVEDDSNKKGGFHKMVSRGSLKKEHNLKVSQNNQSNQPNSGRSKGGNEKQAENPATGNSMYNMESEDSARGGFNMNDKLKGMKDKPSLKNPLLHVLKVGVSFEVDEDMTHYLAMPSARTSDRPKHFDIEQGEKMATEPDATDAEKYSSTPQKLIFNDSKSQKGTKFSDKVFISTDKLFND